VAEEEVQALVNVPDVDALLVSTSTQDQLLKVQEGALVGNVLTDLQRHKTHSSTTYIGCHMQAL
jgi:hypothetical protein